MRDKIFALGALVSLCATCLNASIITTATFSIAEPGTLPFLCLGGGMIACGILLRRISRR
jgi:hypothetical protein